MHYFPIFMNLHDEQVLVVGGGQVAERKIRLLMRAGARVHVVAPVLCETVARWAAEQRLHVLGGVYEAGQLEGQRLVFAATDDRALNRKVFHDAERRGVAVNVVDDTVHCRFISPALVDRSPVQVAISTGGSSPVLARRLRAWLERLLPRGLGSVADAAARLREEVKETLPAPARRRFWEAQLSDENLHRWSSLPADVILAGMRRALRRAPPRATAGRVYLVGAGPGRRDLLTLRALEVLGQADVVLHDRLVTEEILDLARRDADCIDVGKQAGQHRLEQQEIQQIMLREAARGRTVVRLKGGDAFIFGRGGEELEALRAAGVDYEVVPGITAAIGCAAYAGIPLTHRDHARSLTFVTGRHSVQDKGPVADWGSVAGPDRTVVVYMGVLRAEQLRRELLEAGIAPNLPVALVVDGTRDEQQYLAGTVGSLCALAAQVGPGRPGLLIIGQVAALGSNLGWFKLQTAVKTAA
ncbi:MAG: siroheme synthase CysG [Xanthomonadales bacterium]|nr:siroheme synthase CysG [Xanthomonadales bacterium]